MTSVKDRVIVSYLDRKQGYMDAIEDLQNLFREEEVGMEDKPKIWIPYEKWWHRFVPHKRRMNKAMNAILKYHREHGMDEKIEKAVEDNFFHGYFTIDLSK